MIAAAIEWSLHMRRNLVDRSRLWLVGALVMTAAVPSASSQQDAASKIFLAMADQRGPEITLVPLAIYDGKKWAYGWPWVDNDHPPPTPKDLDAMSLEALGAKLPTQWLLWRESDGGRIPLNAVRPGPVDLDPLMTFGLLTDYRGGSADRDAYAPALGVAVAGKAEIGYFTKASTLGVRLLLDRMAPRLAAVEQATLRAFRKQFPAFEGVTLKERRREGYDPTGRVQLWSSQNSALHFLSGDRVLESPQTCSVSVSFEGVITTNASGAIVKDTISGDAWDQYCGDRASSIEPVASVTWPGGLVWVIRYVLEDGDEYQLFDPIKGKVIER
jgi:hypothetical protein